MYILRENTVETTLLMSHTKQWDNTHTTINYIDLYSILSLSLTSTLAGGPPTMLLCLQLPPLVGTLGSVPRVGEGASSGVTSRGVACDAKRELLIRNNISCLHRHAGTCR